MKYSRICQLDLFPGQRSYKILAYTRVPQSGEKDFNINKEGLLPDTPQKSQPDRMIVELGTFAFEKVC